MTLVVAFFCTDGVVVGADSMLTSSAGQIPIGHLHGKKIYLIDGPQVFAFAGDPGQANRFRQIAHAQGASLAGCATPLDHGLVITRLVVQQFAATGIQIIAPPGGQATLNLGTVLAFAHGGKPQCCVFEGTIQPRLLDQHHFYVAFGWPGKNLADPFLRFLVDTFCQQGGALRRPSLREAVFLTTWVIEHTIRTNPGGVAAPICIAVLEPGQQGRYVVRELDRDEIEDQQQAIEGAEQALRDWRAVFAGQVAVTPPAPPLPRPDPEPTTPS